MIKAVLALGAAFLVAQGAVAAPATLVKSGYASVNGLKMYYEIHGQGRPLVLLHGGFMTIPAWGQTLPALARTRQVIAFELEGHGRTADLDRPLSIEQMAEDVAAAAQQLGYRQVDMMGYSLGGAVTLRIAVRHPDLVRKIVLVSTVYDNEGFYPSIHASWPGMTAQALAGTPMEQDYRKLAPNPDHWPVFVDKMKESLMGFTGWPASDIQSIKAPALVVCGDNDAVRPEFEVQLFRFLGGEKAQGGMNGGPVSHLAVLPGVTHFEIFMRADLLVPLVAPFLDSPTTETGR